MMAPRDLQRRLLFILHRALVEARLLSLGGKSQQVCDLADALEQLPGWIAAWKVEHLAELRFNLETYAAKYPEAFGYLELVDEKDPPLAF